MSNRHPQRNIFQTELLISLTKGLLIPIRGSSNLSMTQAENHGVFHYLPFSHTPVFSSSPPVNSFHCHCYRLDPDIHKFLPVPFAIVLQVLSLFPLLPYPLHCLLSSRQPELSFKKIKSCNYSAQNSPLAPLSFRISKSTH